MTPRAQSPILYAANLHDSYQTPVYVAKRTPLSRGAEVKATRRSETIYVKTLGGTVERAVNDESDLSAVRVRGTRTELGLLRSASRELHAIHYEMASRRGER